MGIIPWLDSGPPIVPTPHTKAYKENDGGVEIMLMRNFSQKKTLRFMSKGSSKGRLYNLFGLQIYHFYDNCLK